MSDPRDNVARGVPRTGLGRHRPWALVPLALGLACASYEVALTCELQAMAALEPAAAGAGGDEFGGVRPAELSALTAVAEARRALAVGASLTCFGLAALLWWLLRGSGPLVVDSFRAVEIQVLERPADDLGRR